VLDIWGVHLDSVTRCDCGGCGVFNSDDVDEEKGSVHSLKYGRLHRHEIEQATRLGAEVATNTPLQHEVRRMSHWAAPAARHAPRRSTPHSDTKPQGLLTRDLAPAVATPGHELR